MKILITGGGGFIGKNLTAALQCSGEHELLEFHSGDSEERLREYCAVCEFVFHLAGVNRPEREEDFETGNAGFTRTLADCLAEGNRCPVVFSSSTQAELENPYGRSKRHAEDILQEYGARTGAWVYLYRLPNVFGKWCRPNYNSAVATFCHNIANGLPCHVSDENKMLRLVHIDDVVEEFLRMMNGRAGSGFYAVSKVYEKRLGDIVELIQMFSQCEKTLTVPNLEDAFTKKLYSTYLSGLPASGLRRTLSAHSDDRGAFAEFLRTDDRGQISINVTKPGCVKGNHWHHTKHEVFLVVSGEGVICLRKLGEQAVIEIPVSGEKLEPVIIPPGYTHMLKNTSDTDLVTVMWANEPFDPQRPDTYYLAVYGGAPWES